MQEVKVIENELVPVYETSTGEKVVYGMKFHAVLEVKSRYREWINRRIDDCEALKTKIIKPPKFRLLLGNSIIYRLHSFSNRIRPWS